ncbi:hypothetical protein MSAN_02333000 [Mycena sanguinolenta]|uniref:Uncharacterized protein n=1 Tax=Mycena sanguinolenta TaxID=230812 RepID=A0A8H6X6X9_9AGAR|nr:hypothetical protein MSAN_02333000 [Mycena sanguinolenta]
MDVDLMKPSWSSQSTAFSRLSRVDSWSVLYQNASIARSGMCQHGEKKPYARAVVSFGQINRGTDAGVNSSAKPSETRSGITKIFKTHLMLHCPAGWRSPHTQRAYNEAATYPRLYPYSARATSKLRGIRVDGEIGILTVGLIYMIALDACSDMALPRNAGGKVSIALMGGTGTGKTTVNMHSCCSLGGIDIVSIHSSLISSVARNML